MRNRSTIHLKVKIHHHLIVRPLKTEVYSIRGKLLIRKTLQIQFEEIDLQAFARGTYIVRVLGDGISEVRKIIIE